MYVHTERDHIECVCGVVWCNPKTEEGGFAGVKISLTEAAAAVAAKRRKATATCNRQQQ